MEVIYYIIPEIVTVRKHPVNISALQKTLKSHKNLTIKKISEDLGVTKTEVEHWFRTDKYFSIPRADIWGDLKKLLKIKTNQFDKSITTFENKESVWICMLPGFLVNHSALQGSAKDLMRQEVHYFLTLQSSSESINQNALF